jgi:hypothetical protein
MSSTPAPAQNTKQSSLTEDSSKGFSTSGFKKAFIPILAFVSFTVSLILQFFTIKHGSSGQLAINSDINTGLAITAIPLTIFLFSFFYFIEFENSKYYKASLLGFVMAAYIMSNIALYFSMNQVIVKKP